jgi:hypothetical protein
MCVYLSIVSDLLTSLMVPRKQLLKTSITLLCCNSNSSVSFMIISHFVVGLPSVLPSTLVFPLVFVFCLYIFGFTSFTCISRAW